MPNKSGAGYADYVLYDDAHRPLAVIEAKKTCADVANVRQQAKLYADLLEKEYGRRPVIFLTNGFDTRINDGQYPERKISAFYSKRDLEKWFNIRAMRESLGQVSVDKNIAGRYYQEGAIKAVCDAFDAKNEEKYCLSWLRVRARRVRSSDCVRRFLTPDLSATNLVEEKDIFHYFDAPLIGLTATPKDEIENQCQCGGVRNDMERGFKLRFCASLNPRFIYILSVTKSVNFNIQIFSS